MLTSRADLTKAQAERDDAQRNLQATQKLQQSGGASPAEVEAAQNRQKKAEADVQLLQAKVNGRYSSPEVAKVEASAAEARAAYAASAGFAASFQRDRAVCRNGVPAPGKAGSAM